MIRARIIILASTYDEAGMNIVEPLRSIFKQVEVDEPDHWPDGDYQWSKRGDDLLLITSQPHYQAAFLADSFDADLIIVASKHISGAEQKAILTHALGNWHQARHESGRDNELAYVNPSDLTMMYDLLRKSHNRDQGTKYWVGVEATHHGPTEVDIPILFVEVGGTETEWKDKDACRIVSEAILEFIETYPHSLQLPSIIGIGGGHYLPAFLRRMEAGMFLLGHSLPKYGIKGLKGEMLQEAWDKTVSEDKLFLIDKSGTKSSQRSYITKILDELGLPYAMTSDFPTS